tara:strand:+ start:939 stop:1187 length:249 start_codon:yes stop_codon:yes gene_type:complete
MEQKQMNDVFKQLQDQIKEMADILKTLTKVVKENREFIEKNAHLSKKTVEVVATMENAYKTQKEYNIEKQNENFNKGYQKTK